MQKLFAGIVCGAITVATLAGCGPSAPPPPGPKPVSHASQDWAKASKTFVENYLMAQPYFAAQSGRHEFDGKLPDLSEHGLKREIARLRDARSSIEKVDAAGLTPRERFDREYLLSVATADLFWLEKSNFPYSNPEFYMNAIDPDMYLSRNYAPLDVRLKAYIRYARGIPQIAKDVQDNFKLPLPKTYVELGIDQFGGLADFFSKNVGPVFASVNDSDLQKQLNDADAAAAAAMNNLKQYLIAQRKAANDKYALGPAVFEQMLQDTDSIDMPVDQIEAAGRADLERNTAALKTECDAYAPKATLAQCVAKVMADKPKAGPVQEARAQLTMLKDFIAKNGVVTIPNDTEALVAEAPPYNRANAAFINVPGPFEHGVASIYNIAPPDPKWSKAEQAAYIPSEGTLLFTSVHEVWPGHFLQFLHANANQSKLEGLWVGYAFAEGWAHYSEEMMYEVGLGKGDPEKHIGQLTDALLRNVRLLSAIGLHTHGMSVAQSEKMFREQAFQDPGNARQQAARGTYDPAYLNYTIGKLMIRKLRTDWMTQHPSSVAADDPSRWKAFHDEFLSYGGPSIPLLRKQMLGNAGSLL